MGRHVHLTPAPRPRSRGHSGGITRERAARKRLEAEGWLVVRAAGSLGVADLVAFRADMVPRLVECKSTAQGPYEHFGPAPRSRLSAAAALGGIEAWLLWWPPRRQPVWLAEHEWPAATP